MRDRGLLGSERVRLVAARPELRFLRIEVEDVRDLVRKVVAWRF